jgi:hypothetical protein
MEVLTSRVYQGKVSHYQGYNPLFTVDGYSDVSPLERTAGVRDWYGDLSTSKGSTMRFISRSDLRRSGLASTLSWLLKLNLEAGVGLSWECESRFFIPYIARSG